MKRAQWYKSSAAPKFRDSSDNAASLFRGKRSNWSRRGAAPKFRDDTDYVVGLERFSGMSPSDIPELLRSFEQRRKRGTWHKTGAAPKFRDEIDLDSFAGYNYNTDLLVEIENELENELNEETIQETADALARRAAETYKCVTFDNRVYCGVLTEQTAENDQLPANLVRMRREDPTKRCHRVNGNYYCYTAPEGATDHPEGTVQDETFTVADQAIASSRLTQHELEELVNSGRINRVPHADAALIREQEAMRLSAIDEAKLADEIKAEAEEIANEVVHAKNERKAGKIMRRRMKAILHNAELASQTDSNNNQLVNSPDAIAERTKRSVF